MNRFRSAALMLLIMLLTAVSEAGWSQSPTPFTSSELDDLLAPIALYPDPLLAQILPAATFPDQLDEAANIVSLEDGQGMIDSQDWDVSVKAIAYYPPVLRMMVDKPDWTAAIGQAYLDQSEDVMDSIQRLRAKARLLGYLPSNRQRNVYLDSGYIRIVPAQAEYIYVPQYDPEVVYYERPYYDDGSSNLISFSLGLVIGPG